MARVHQIIVVVAGISIAAAFLDRRFVGLVATSITILIALAGVVCRRSARAFLPRKPVGARRFLEFTAVTDLAIAAGVAAIPFWAAAKLPSKLSAGPAAAGTILGVATAVAVVEVARALTVDGGFIEERVGKRFQSDFLTSYQPQLEKSGSGPIPNPREHPDDPPADVWLNTFDPDMYGGWNFDARKRRAKAIADWIKQVKPPFV